ncbi:AAA family ATPase [bacterium]|nr:AAA family ATPase [bacterium]
MLQSEALSVLKTGVNVFLTGEPGSGKTHTINAYVEYARSCGIEPSITASTGIAATHVGGMTIHAWSGIGVRKDLSAYDLDAIAGNKNVHSRVRHAQILIIDEISMLSARTLDMVDTVCREVRGNQSPFGGLQVILVGDFFQLPPVSRAEADDEGQIRIAEERREKFAYESRAWADLNPLVCYLSEQHRQVDGPFLEILSTLRRATFGEDQKKILRTRYARVAPEGVTQLYAHNANVDVINMKELEKLSGKVVEFGMHGKGPEKVVNSLRRSCLSPEKLLLKVGARVMFTKNDLAPQKYVNGTLGTVTGFADSGFPVVETRAGTVIAEPDEWHVEDGGRIIARIMQVPLRLAWAITVHKSQGMSLDAVHMDLSSTFEYGQGYVALSRARTLAGLSIAGLNQRATEVHPDVLQEDEKFREKSEKVQKHFQSVSVAEIETLHANFIRACGGKFGAGRNVKEKQQPGSSLEITLKLIKAGNGIAEIAKERELKVATIIDHLEQLKDLRRLDMARDCAHLTKPKHLEKMQEALLATADESGNMPLSPARAFLGERYSFDDLRLARLFFKE